MSPSVSKIGQTGFDFLADEDFIHQIIPTGGLGQLAHQTGGLFLNGRFFSAEGTPRINLTVGRDASDYSWCVEQD